MSAFYSGGFYSGGFFTSGAGGAATQVARAVAELLAVVPSDPAVSRVAAEVLSGLPPTVTRAAVELLAEVPYTFGQPSGGASRAAVEVLGLVDGALGKLGHVGRVAVEAMGPADTLSTGLEVTPMTLTAHTVALVLDLNGVSSAGSLGLTDAAGRGLRVSWGSSPASSTIAAFIGPNGTEYLPLSLQSGLAVVVTHTDGALGTVQPQYIGAVRPLEAPGSAVLRELMVWGRVLTPQERYNVYEYLQTKWVDGLPIQNFVCLTDAPTFTPTLIDSQSTAAGVTGGGTIFYPGSGDATATTTLQPGILLGYLTLSTTVTVATTVVMRLRWSGVVLAETSFTLQPGTSTQRVRVQAYGPGGTGQLRAEFTPSRDVSGSWYLGVRQVPLTISGTPLVAVGDQTDPLLGLARRNGELVSYQYNYAEAGQVWGPTTYTGWPA